MDRSHKYIVSLFYLYIVLHVVREGDGTPLQYSCLENPMDRGAWWAAVHGVSKSRTRLSDFPFTFHFHALEKEMATHSSVLAWRIPGTEDPGGLPSMGSHRVGHNWSDCHLATTCGKTNLVSAVKRVVVSRDKSGLGVERAVSGILEIFYMVGSWVYSVCEKSSSCMLIMWIYHCIIGEGNGNPLQCSCLENPRDGRAWWAAVYGVAQSRTRLKQLSSSMYIILFKLFKSVKLFYLKGGMKQGEEDGLKARLVWIYLVWFCFWNHGHVFHI